MKFSYDKALALGIACCLSAAANVRAAVLVEYDATTAGAGVDPAGVFPAWQRFGVAMTNNGTFLLQDNTADDPGNDESGEYLSPVASAGLMKLASGSYGVEFRVKPLTDVPNLGGGHYANLYVVWSDDTFIYNVTIDKDTDDAGPGTTGGIRYGQNSMSSAVTGIDWSTPHTIFIGYNGASPSGSFNFYVDGQYAATVSANNMARTGGFPFAQDRVDFGDGTTGQNVDAAAQWYFMRVHDTSVPPNARVLVQYDAAAAGAGVRPNDLGWQRFGVDMTNNGTYLLQDNTSDDPTTESGEYLSPLAGNGLMKRGSGQYGIEVRIQPLTDVPFLSASHFANLYVFWSDDTYAYNITIDKYTNDVSGTGGIKYGQNSMSDAVTGIDWSTPHTLFIGYRGDVSPAQGGTFDFYIDNVYKSSAIGNNMARTGGFPFAQNRIDFGDGTTGQGIDVAARWYFLKIHSLSYPDVPIPTGLLADYTASTAGAGVTPSGVSPPWSRFGVQMTNNGTFLLQDNTINDPITESTEYLSPPVGGLMKLGSGQYGIEFKIRPLTDVQNLAASNYANLYVVWSDDQFQYNLTIDKDTDDAGPETTGGIKFGQNSMADAVTGIDWSVAHKVFVGYRGSALPAGEFDIYVDGVLKTTLTAATFARVGSFARDSVDFGDGTTGQGYDVAAEWYYMRLYGSAIPPVEPPPPCGVIFADRDLDGDVDMDDYAAFQRCYTGPSGTIQPGCSCFDRPEAGFPNGNGHIDANDLSAFSACLSHAGVPANPACDGPP